MASTGRPRPIADFVVSAGERMTMTRALAFLFASGGILVLVSLAIPDAGREPAGVAVPAVLALFVAAALVRAGDRADVRVLQAAVVGGSVLITSCVLAGGEAAGAYAALYVWVSLYAWFFFSPWAAAGQIALAGAGYAAALLLTGGDAPAPGVNWLLGAGTIAVGGVLLGRLTGAIRTRSADLATVGRMAAGQSDLDGLAQETCEELQRSVSADVTLMLEPLPDADGLRITAMSGSSEAGLVFNTAGVRHGLEQAFRTGESVHLRSRAGTPRFGRLRGDVHGLAQPVVRDGAAVGVLALAWTAPRHRLRDGVETAARLFAAEASLALERVERQARDREARALQLDATIVQGLVAAKQALQRDDGAQALQAVEETLAGARALVSDQLEVVSAARGGLRSGDLAREAPAGPTPLAPPRPRPSPR
jgi:GAF domain-containing protein